MILFWASPIMAHPAMMKGIVNNRIFLLPNLLDKNPPGIIKGIAQNENVGANQDRKLSSSWRFGLISFFYLGIAMVG